PPAIVDNGQLFTQDALKKALAEIKDLKNRFKKDLVVETFKVPPPDIQKQLDDPDGPGTSKVFSDWLRQRTMARGGDGVFILMCKEPARIQIAVSDATAQKTFTSKDRDELRELLIADLKGKKNDQVLTDALVFVYDTMDRNTSPPLPAPVAASIQDKADVFTAEARTKAAERILDLKNKQGVDLTVETFPRVYPGGVKRFAAASKEKREELFQNWARE